jgi:hypothetical protein
MIRSSSVLPAIRVLALGLGCLVAACAGTKDSSAMNGKLPTGDEAPPAAGSSAAGSSSAESSVLSSDILAREPVANTATVKHILISWSELAEAFGGQLDPRAAKRSKADAEAEVRSLLKQLQGGADFDQVMKASSEDTVSAASGREFTVTPDAQLVIEFRQLSLRLNPGEVGVCQSDFGFHIIKRMQ